MSGIFYPGICITTPGTFVSSAQDLLKPFLLLMVSYYRLGNGTPRLTAGRDMRPERAIIELTTKNASGGLIDILHFGQDRNFIHVDSFLGGISLQIPITPSDALRVVLPLRFWVGCV